MAGKKDNIKALFSNSRSRVIILFTVILLVITVVIGIIKFSSSTGGAGAEVSLNAGAAEGIQSTPGSLNQTAQYAALQETQNIEQAKKARETGTSAIPTIIRTHAFGEGVQIIGQKEGEGGVDFSALTHDDSGDAQKLLWSNTLKAGDCSKTSLDKVIAQGASVSDLRATCSCTQLKQFGYKAKELEPVCTCAELKTAGFDIVQLKEAGFSADRLRLCGYVACDERGVGFSAKEMKQAGFSDGELKGAGFSDKDIADAGGLPNGITVDDIRKAGCDVDALTRLRKAGVSAAAITRISSCSADKMRAAGFDIDDLKRAGNTAKELADAGWTAKQLKDTGFSAQQMKDAGFKAPELKQVGYTSKELQDAGFSALAGLKPVTPLPAEPSTVLTVPFGTKSSADAIAEANAKRIEDIQKQQAKQLAAQRYQQKIQQRDGAMMAAANQILQSWKTVPVQIYTAGSAKDDEKKLAMLGTTELQPGMGMRTAEFASSEGSSQPIAVIKTGDILFAVIDTSVNSDEPGPILATIVSGKLKGSKLIGSFNLPSKADKMIVTFNTLSVPGMDKTVSITAFAIDPNTARTALSSQTDHHYLSRYGSLFASTFIEGFGNAFQSANTTITIGGTGGTTDTTVSSGVGRSTLENAVIGLATLGKAWGQVAAQNMNRPTTVQLYAGTGVGILFTQDLKLT